MSAGRFLRARPRRAVSVAWALALLSRRLGLVCAGVSSSPPVGRGYMARGGGGREEESLGALPSLAPGAARARPSPASLLRALPAPPPRSSRARPGRVAAASAPHPLPGRLGGWEGARRKRGGLLSPPWRGPQRRAAAARAPPPLLPHNPPLPPLYLRGTQAEGGGARTRPGDNCQLEASLGGGGRGGGWEGQREGGGHSGSPRPARLGRAVEIGKERGTVAIHGAHAY